MKLYYSAQSCSLACIIVLHELGLQCDYIHVDLVTKRTEMGESFLEINAKGAVPALLLDKGLILTENSIIQQYLADMNPATSLLPGVGILNRYRILEWCSYVTADLHKGCCSILYNTNVDAAIKSRVYKPILCKKLQFVNQAVSRSDYLVGAQFTLADANMFFILNWLDDLDVTLSEYVYLNRYFDRLNKRPAIIASLKFDKAYSL